MNVPLTVIVPLKVMRPGQLPRYSLGIAESVADKLAGCAAAQMTVKFAFGLKE